MNKESTERSRNQELNLYICNSIKEIIKKVHVCMVTTLSAAKACHLSHHVMEFSTLAWLPNIIWVK